MTPLPIHNYLSLTPEQCHSRLQNAKQQLGNHLIILGHHYQRDEVIQYADHVGDSLKLSRLAAQSGARYIVFCGVHFMAEVADILSSPQQTAILPDLAAGCSMADMANLAKVEDAWDQLSKLLGPDPVLPITYINSAADLKAFCGKHGGTVCTSSNAQAVLTWSLQQRQKVLFFPDQHLGRNTGYRMGIPLNEMVIWDFDQPQGGLTLPQLQAAKLILWDGYCSVHQLFQPTDIEHFRQRHPTGKVVAHPECCLEVCQQADVIGSTEKIIETVMSSPPGTHWLVGTEWHLVNRLARQAQATGKKAEFMSSTHCQCSTMYRIDLPHLLWVLENLQQGTIVNPISVPSEIAALARLALQRMLAL